jgi:hypothetical protein
MYIYMQFYTPLAVVSRARKKANRLCVLEKPLREECMLSV